MLDMTAEELVQHVWVSKEDRTELEIKLAEALARALDAVEDQGFGEHD